MCDFGLGWLFGGFSLGFVVLVWFCGLACFDMGFRILYCWCFWVLFGVCGLQCLGFVDFVGFGV